MDATGAVTHSVSNSVDVLTGEESSILTLTRLDQIGMMSHSPLPLVGQEDQSLTT